MPSERNRVQCLIHATKLLITCLLLEKKSELNPAQTILATLLTIIEPKLKTQISELSVIFRDLHSFLRELIFINFA